MPQTRSWEVSPDLRTQPPGLHIVSNFESNRRELLNTFEAFREFIDDAISKTQLNKVGEAYHNFEGYGFTAVVCLAESHLSIHTWPEAGYVTFDIFLSNFKNDNSSKGRAIYNEVIRFFDATVVFEKNLER